MGGMPLAMSARRLSLLAFALLLPMGMGGCKVVSITENKATEARAFDAKAYADGVWTQKALPHFAASAQPLAELLPAIASDIDAAGAKFGYRPASEGSPWGFVVIAAGTIKAINTKSRAGTLTLTTEAGDITVQIGPVVKGNSIRDLLPFVSFKDFTNQIDFADAGKALTAAAMAGLGGVVPALTEGQRIEVIGAFTLSKPSDTVLITPVSIKVLP